MHGARYGQLIQRISKSGSSQRCENSNDRDDNHNLYERKSAFHAVKVACPTEYIGTRRMWRVPKKCGQWIANILLTKTAHISDPETPDPLYRR